MKHTTYIIACLLIGTACNIVAQNVPFKPAKADRNPDDYNTVQPEITTEELAMPPPGEIQKIHLRLVNSIKDGLAHKLATVPSGPDGKDSQWFSKALVLKNSFEAVATSRLQTSCFALIPLTVEFLKANHADLPNFIHDCKGLASGSSSVVIHAIERHVIDQNGIVSADHVRSFISVFSNYGYISAGDWEASPIPINAGGIMILDASAVVSHLKTLPWQEARQFLGNNTAADAFERYEASGDGIPALKAKYTFNKATINAKWKELEAWVKEQQAADPAYAAPSEE